MTGYSSVMDFNHTVTLVYSSQSLSQPLGHVSMIPAYSRKVAEKGSASEISLVPRPKFFAQNIRNDGRATERTKREK